MFRQIIFKIIAIVVVAYAAAYPFTNQPTSPTVAVKTPVSKAVKPATNPVKKTKIQNVHLPDFAKIRDVKQKKRAFFDFMKPFVEEVNEEILAARKFVKSFNPATAEPSDIKRIKALAKRYRIKKLDDLPKVKDRLLTRVDIIPTELVLMQAANESGWGTSRFALEANNLFGQWCFRKGCGVIPSGRPQGKTYEVRKFKTPADSIRSYFHNLNTGHAYTELRQLRRKNREIDEDLDPYLIAEGLLPYSTRREAYVEEIQNMLRVNQKYI